MNKGNQRANRRVFKTHTMANKIKERVRDAARAVLHVGVSEQRMRTG